jgi:hypothetical protein
MTWTELCQKNVDHYNQSPTVHNTITVAYGAAVVGLLIVARRRLAKTR